MQMNGHPVLSPWKDLASDRAREKNGVWWDLPGTNWRFLIARRCRWNRRHAEARARLVRLPQFRGAMERIGSLAEGEQAADADLALWDDIELRAFVEGCVLDWQNVVDRAGEAIPFSIDAARQLLIEMPALYAMLDDVARDHSRYGPELEPPVEDQLKN